MGSPLTSLDRAALFFRRLEQFARYTPHLEDCLKFVEEANEHPNDIIAVALVKLEHLYEKIHQCPWHVKPENSVPNAATLFMVDSLHDQMRQFHSALPLTLKNNGKSLLHPWPLLFLEDLFTLWYEASILMQYHAAEVSLYEAGLSKPLAMSTEPGSDFKRLELLCACLQAAKSCFDVFFALPLREYFAFTMPNWMDLTYCLIMTHVLSTFEHPGTLYLLSLSASIPDNKT